jgi:hypothetical protein
MKIKINTIHPVYIETTVIDSETPEFIHTHFKIDFTAFINKTDIFEGKATIEHLQSLEAIEAIIESKIKTAINETNQSK